MSIVIRTLSSGLHAHWTPMPAPLLFAGNVKTIPDLRDGFESLNIMWHVLQRVEFGNEGAQIESHVIDDYTNYNCRK